MTSDNSDRSVVVKSSLGLRLGVDDDEDDHRRGRSPPQRIGDVSISDSADIHIGHNITYKAPVNITQHVYTGDERIDAAASSSQARRFSLFRLSICHWSRRKKAWSIGLAALTTIVVVAVVVVCVGSLAATTGTSKFPPWNNDSWTNNNDTLVDGLLVPRGSWGARAPSRASLPLRDRPPGLVIILHTASQWCETRDQCSASARNIQQYQMAENDYNDVAYNFMLGGDSLLYEGRGWLARGASSGYEYNAKSLAVAFLGNYELDRPKPEQLAALEAFLEVGTRRGLLRPDYKLLGHRQVSSTESPGRHLYEAIKKLKHWSPSP
ncbi:peptidoglycan recognition protein 1-like [Trichogramma pretiosum]|uniref:peptidoglycan recognition protein 1-like n=1 Tax=Trichogramma pretiosum TaxID=7493 RepID=UPI000C71B6D6|nr:peptidoglycan recognition protein 1-like [Trichogramma pretiosum]XP_023318774.1 peptidoglycan recognition protein 1-like [Trichogramma pretiosum]